MEIDFDKLKASMNPVEYAAPDARMARIAEINDSIAPQFAERAGKLKQWKAEAEAAGSWKRRSIAIDAYAMGISFSLLLCGAFILLPEKFMGVLAPLSLLLVALFFAFREKVAAGFIYARKFDLAPEELRARCRTEESLLKIFLSANFIFNSGRLFFPGVDRELTKDEVDSKQIVESGIRVSFEDIETMIPSLQRESLRQRGFPNDRAPL